MNADERHIQRALELAGTALGETFPNPLVGAVVVKDGEVAGEGYHCGAGCPHAEIKAIDAAGERTRGATLYLNLEPCCHQGKTPPCTNGIVEAGIARVVFSMYDPDRRVRGKGAAALRASGVEVCAGLAAADALELNLPYVHRCLTGKPFVAVKLASTLDGRLTRGTERRLSGDAEQRYVHRLRAWTEAIAIGIGTVEKDAPRLDRRLHRDDMAPPVRMVFDSELRLPHDYPWLVRGERVIVYCIAGADGDRRGRLEAAGAEIVPLPAGGGGIDLAHWLDDVKERGITSVLVEGGGEVATSFLRDGRFDRLVLCYAPTIGGVEAVGWYQCSAPPDWLAEKGFVLSRLEALDNDIVAVYDSPAIASYLETVTEEKTIVHWPR